MAMTCDHGIKLFCYQPSVKTSIIDLSSRFPDIVVSNRKQSVPQESSRRTNDEGI